MHFHRFAHIGEPAVPPFVLFSALAILCLAAAHPAPAQAEKAPPPSKESVAKALEQVKEVYRADWAKAKTNAEKLVIAEDVIKQGIGAKNDPPGQYALLGFGRDLATLAGGVDLALKAVAELDNAFEVNAVEMRRDLLVAVSKATRTPKEVAELAPKVADAADQAAAGDRYDIAKELSELAASLARRSANPTLLKDLTARTNEMQLRVKDGAAYQAALTTLATKPEDPEANLAVGKFRVFIKGDFGQGMLHLAKGNDPTLRTLAASELANPTAAADLTRLADGWLELADKEKDLLRKAHLRQRAKHWYEAALPSATGLTKARVENRLEELAKSDEGVGAASPAKPGGRKLTAKGKISASADDRFDLAINGKAVLSGSDRKEAFLDVELKVGDVLSARASNAEYSAGFALIFLSEDKRQVFFTNGATWRCYVPPDPNSWEVVKPSPQDLPVKEGERYQTATCDGLGNGYGVDAVWGHHPKLNYFYHVVNEQDLEILADPPLKASKKGTPVAGKISASADDMYDLAVNGKPILSGRYMVESNAAVELRSGDVITVRGANSNYGAGFLFAFTSNEGNIAFYSNPTTWFVYQPNDVQRWWRVRGNEPTSPAKPGDPKHLVLSPHLFAKAVCIWCNDNNKSGYLLHVVTEQDLKKPGK